MVAANGFKNLFKKDEIENVIEKLYQNGWITEEEYKSYNSPRNQKFLKDISKNIDNQRKAKPRARKKNTKA